VTRASFAAIGLHSLGAGIGGCGSASSEEPKARDLDQSEQTPAPTDEWIEPLIAASLAKEVPSDGKVRTMEDGRFVVRPSTLICALTPDVDPAIREHGEDCLGWTVR
jgi:hypothetical protein